MKSGERDTSAPDIFNISSFSNLSRKSFLKWTAFSAAVMGFGISLNSCNSNDDNIVIPNGGIDLGAGDSGIFNYTYAIEQLQAAFYAKVVSSFYAGITEYERTVLNDIAVHELIHRDFFKAVIPASSRISDGLTFNTDTIDFTSRTSVLSAARKFEDIPVLKDN